MSDSQQLLAEYVRNGSEAAFGELVTRYLDLVHSVAFRLVDGDAHRAQDVAQTVFLDLARCARSLSPDVMLGGWLHRHTCFVAAKTMRGERRRQSRERQAVEMNALHDDSHADLTLITPMLDAAINELGDEDRTAILLRFFEQRDFRSVGAALGSNEDAARMRVNRALEKLHSLLMRRGVATTAAALSVTLSANAIQAAPVGLAASISTAAVHAGTGVVGTATAIAAKTVAATTLQKVAAAVALGVACGAGIYEAHRAARFTAQVQTNRQQHDLAVEKARQLQLERDNAKSKVISLAREVATLKSNSTELLKLRAEVTRLGRVSRELERFEAAGGSFSQLETNLAFALKYPGPRWKPYLEQNALSILASLKKVGDLSLDQEKSVRELLLKQVDLRDEAMQQEFNGSQTTEGKEEFTQSNSIIIAQINALLSPEQQAALNASHRRETEAMARLDADGELYSIQQIVGISREQEQKILPILSDFALRRRLGDFADDTEELNALAKVVGPEQLDQYKKAIRERIFRVVVTAWRK